MKTLALLLTSLFLITAQAADKDTPPDVQSLMTPEDFAASGLDKLSGAERKHLSEWVERYREGAVVGPVVKKPPSKMTEEEKVVYEEKKEEEKEEKKKTRITAKVIPRLRGWNGKTVFKLDNGQTWQQRTPGKYRYSGDDSTVIITVNWMGKYLMEHQESGRTVGVRRID